MKYAILFIGLLLAGTASSQHVRFGVKGGGDVSLFNASGPQNITAKPGFGGYAGGIVEIGKFDGSRPKLQFELVASQRGIKNNYKVGDDIISKRSISLFQLSFPVLFRYFIRPSFSLNAGGAFNYNVYAQGKTTSVKNNATVVNKYMDKDQLQSVQGNLLLGINYYYMLGFFLDVRYNFFGTPLLKDIGTLNYKDNLHTIQVGVGYKFQHHMKVKGRK